MVYNVKSREMVQIPPVVGRVNDVVNPNWGVYTIKINPSRTLLATNAHNSKEIAVYKMPSLNPIYLTEVRFIFIVDHMICNFFVIYLLLF